MTATPGWTLPLHAPLPGTSFSGLLDTLGLSPRLDLPIEGAVTVPEGTTVLALRHVGGVVMAGDRRATEGNLVAHRSIQKVYPADGHSAVAIAGTAGLAIEMVRLFQVELEHYEKIEGMGLSLEGKANYLARLVRNQLSLAFQGLVVVPLFGGFDELAGDGRVFSFDVVGGRYEELDFGTTGSGARLAKAFLRTTFRPDLDAEEAVRLSVRALVAASQEDTATGGPDLLRNILPTVYVIDSSGVREISSDVLRPVAERAVEEIR